MSSSSYARCRHCCFRRRDGKPPISHFPNPAPEIAHQLAQIDAEIQRNNEAISALIKKGALLNRKRNTLVPAVELPPEVLALIFEFACFCTYDRRRSISELYFGLNPYECTCAISPIVISSVCSAWRSIALAASQLWSNVRIEVSDKHAEAHASLLRHWFSHSALRPLTVRLFEGTDVDSKEGDDSDSDLSIQSTAVIDILATYAHRLHTFELFLPISWKSALIRIAQCIPLLTRLTLHTGRNTRYFKDVNFFNDAPQLREVTLIGYNSQDVSLPWTQLERLHGTSSMVECHKILLTCPRLRHYTVSLSTFNRSPIVAAPAIHPALEAFELVADSATVLEGLTLSGLRSLFVSFSADPPCISTIPTLLSHSAHTLEILHMNCILPPEEDLVACLRALPGLRRLLVRVPQSLSYKRTLKQGVLDQMNPNKCAGQSSGKVKARGSRKRARAEANKSASGQCLVPNLESFHYEGSIGFNLHALVEFLASRWPDIEIPQISGPGGQPVHERPPPGLNMPTVRLRSLTFKTSFEIEFDDDDAAVVERLRREGMHLDFLKR